MGLVALDLVRLVIISNSTIIEKNQLCQKSTLINPLWTKFFFFFVVFRDIT